MGKRIFCRVAFSFVSIIGTGLYFLSKHSTRELESDYEIAKETTTSSGLFQVIQETTQQLNATTRLPTTQLWRNSCGSPLSLVFMKTHKTGSTTILFLLRKFIKKRKVKNQNTLAAVPEPFIGGYPGRFRSDFCFLDKNNPLRNEVKADFLTRHSRFNKEEMQAVMNPKAIYFSIMRDPFAQFESTFHFYYGQYIRKRPTDPISCHMYPYWNVTKEKWVTFSEYLNLTEDSLDESVPWFFRSRNFQAFDLGLDPSNLSNEYVLLEAKKLDEALHLVLILEHFLESLVLLKDLLCMEWKDVVTSAAANQGHYKTHAFSDRERNIVAKLTSQDRILYNYFNASLWRKIELYGYERMKKDVANLQKLMGKPRNVRKKRSLPQPARTSPYYPGKVLTKEEAMKSLTGKIKRQLMAQKLTPKDGNLAEKISQYMTDNSGWCPIQQWRIRNGTSPV